ncbi:PTI1-like tyrosine-protein kinase [Capsicum annuum]|uniref:PTI1-like tyrosine-protein kinase At3g15890 n=1 Tax=Capsicum annuum TaxID=4072 RepID=UPI001FB18F1A|nr:PTI1-like tyrosine-protein kinase At3g15890 [Capsicum annuum]
MLVKASKSCDVCNFGILLLKLDSSEKPIEKLNDTRPTMLEVIELLKGESKEKFTALENNEMFKIPPAVGDDALSGEKGNTDSATSDEKEPK